MVCSERVTRKSSLNRSTKMKKSLQHRNLKTKGPRNRKEQVCYQECRQNLIRSRPQRELKGLEPEEQREGVVRGEARGRQGHVLPT